MIARYTKKEMADLWTPEAKFHKMLDVELAVARVQARRKIIPEKAYRNIRKLAKFSVKRIEQIEATTKHDVIAFVSNLAENVGESGKYIHYGLTSSDVLDTALNLQIQDAGELILVALKKVDAALMVQIKRHATTLCAGRTHGMHAEVTTFGLKLAGFLAELRRHQIRMKLSLEDLQIGKLSGAVGAYTNMSPKIEAEICAELKLSPETIATQVIPRDRLAQLFSTFAMIGAWMERLAVELRHLQRTEVSEVTESFSAGQKGSSAMPHKKNPISAENLTGISRLLRTYLHAAFENMVLWHERDISHSSVERVLLPDAFIACHYALHRLAELVQHLQVDKKRMQQNMELSRGQLFSSQVLLLLVQKGLSREEAYKVVQDVSHGLGDGDSFSSALQKDSRVKRLVKKSEWDLIFKDSNYQKKMKEIIGRVVKI